MEIPLLGFDLPAWIVLVVTLLILLYNYNSRNIEALRELGLPGPTPYPIIGTSYKALKIGVGKADLENIKEYGKVYAAAVGSAPVFVVADSDLLKQIMVKDFNFFTNRRNLSLGQKPLDKMMNTVEDDEWRNIRNATTPAFSGGKLRKTTKDINECVHYLVSNLANVADECKPFEVKKFCGSYSADIIARVAFGVDMDSQNDPNHPFVKHMMKTLDFSLLNNPYLLIAIFLPFLIPLAKKLGMSLFKKDTVEYFSSLVHHAIDQRKQSDDGRNDFLQLMLEAQRMKPEKNGQSDENKQRKPLTDDEVLSNCVIFIFSAFGTVGDAMSMTLYALATNPEMQEKLFEEIKNVVGDSKQCSYDQVNELLYLDMVVSEGLRMYSPAQVVDRTCSQDVVINGIKFPKGVIVNIPIYAIHMDPEIWPEPEKFIPERFSPEKKATMNPYHWLPFGFGPRNCIGMRMALIEMKIAFVHLIRNFKIKTCEPDQKLTRHKVTGSPVNLALKVEKR